MIVVGDTEYVYNVSRSYGATYRAIYCSDVKVTLERLHGTHKTILLLHGIM